jgi:hypothetical protein
MTNEKYIWWRCFSFPELVHICDITGDIDIDNPPSHDPRIGGNGKIVWQKLD